MGARAARLSSRKCSRRSLVNEMAYDYRDYWPSLHKEERGLLSAVGNSALGEGFNRIAYGRRRAALHELLDRASVPGGAVCLEGACGVGAYAEVWKHRGVSRWMGVDISREAIADLKRRYPQDQFAVLDMTSPTWGDLETDPGTGSCDVVTGIDVLYHLTDDAAFTAALTNLSRFVRVGGCLVVSDIFPDEVVQAAPHVRRRPIASYEAALGPLGFQLAGREPVFGVMGDSVRRNGLADAAVFQTWRVCQKIVRSSPPRARKLVGAFIASIMLPVDAAVRWAGLAAGSNLELALFRRRNS
jgi:2-polyprenyl-3-methyl-5-hydroxy-6-metoxy-1,4-benzoquinol methylase